MSEPKPITISRRLVALVASMNKISKPSRGAIDKQGKYVLDLPNKPEMSAEIEAVKDFRLEERAF